MSEGSVVVVIVLLPDMSRTARRLDPVPEVVLDVLWLQRLTAVVRGQEALRTILPGVVLHQCPLRIPREAGLLPQGHARLQANNRQGARLRTRRVMPGEVRQLCPREKSDKWKNWKRLALCSCPYGVGIQGS